MNPNKKRLDPKNNSPWLLCPSKTFPGKFYYFNGSTGETAWCLSETDKNLKKGTIHRITDKTHSCPEPFDPPIDDSTNTTNSFTSLKNAGNTEFGQNTKEIRPSPVFGQAVFPKYVSPDIYPPNFVWSLTPMFVPTQPHRQMLDQPYYQPMYMPSSVQNIQPLKSTFTPNFQYQNQPYQYKDRPMFDQTTKFNASKLSKEAQTSAKPLMKDEACQTFVPIQAKRLRRQSMSVENLTTLFTKDFETSTINPLHKVENECGKLSELDKNDLRFKLVAKKKKVESKAELEATEKSAEQSTSSIRECQKKRVTFDIQETSNASSEDIQEIDQSLESSQMGELSQQTDGAWYVVADTAALLTGFQCIEEFVKSDVHCSLLVPHAVYTELEERSRGDLGSLPARQLLRKLASPDSQIVVQSKPEYELSSEDSILQCCWNILQEDCHVVLISNNINILNEAKTIDLEHYTVDEIKNGHQTATEPTNNPKKLNIVVVNDKNKSENLFLQDLSELSGLSLPKPNGFKINEPRINIFNAEHDNNDALCNKDANSDKLINLTRPKNNVTTVFNSEISNVKDQITKLSIAENRSVNIRTKQIMKNVLRTTGLNDKIDQDTTVDKENTNCNQNQRNVPKKLEIIDEIDRDIRRLNVTENKKKSRDTIKVSGITKLNNQFDLDDDLERFYIKNRIVENRVKSRLEEWMCRLNQTMEGVLTEILLKEKTKHKKMMPPWNLFEAIQITGETFKKHPHLKTIIDRFSMKLLNCSSNTGKLNKDIKPNDFMKLVGLSMILIEHLKEIVNCKELYEADDMLVDLIKNIEDPKTDIDLSLDKVNTLMISRSEISDVTPAGFRKSRFEIVDYLKKHFEAWQSHETENLVTDKIINKETETKNAGTDKKINKDPNIVRTCGKDLNTLKINNTKAITVENKEADKDEKNQLKVIRNVTIIAAFEERLKKKAELDLDRIDYEENGTVYTISSDDDNESARPNVGNEDTKHLPDDFILDDLSLSVSSVNSECARAYPLVKNKEADKDEKNQLKVIRNVTIIPAFEERLKKKAELDLDQIDYEENGTVYTISSDDDNEIARPNVRNEDTKHLPDDFILDDLSLSVSGVNSECARAYPLVKVFLLKLKTTLMKIFEFINTSIQEYKEGLSVDKMADMVLKTELTQQYVLKITERLKNIIARESNGGRTVKDLLVKAGDHVDEDLIMSNYKQTVTKYLEQTQILGEVLQHMLSLPNAVNAKEKEEPYSDSLNTSPILPTRMFRSNQLTSGRYK